MGIMDKLTSMRVFTHVAKHGSFTAVATELAMSRAMVTKHVSQLENSLGVRLLNRTTRSLSLTEVGKLYLERCEQIFADLEETELAISSSQPKGTLKICAPPSFGVFHLAPAIPDYMEQQPEVKVELSLRESFVDLVAAGLDLAIVVGSLDDSSLISRRLATVDLLVCASPRYLHKFGTPTTPSELKQHNCLVNFSHPPTDEWPFRHADGTMETVKVKGTMQSNVADALHMAALKGLGLALLPAYMVGTDLFSRRLRVVLGELRPLPVEILAVYPHRRHLSPKVRTFVDFLAARFQPIAYWDEWYGVAGDELR